MYVLSTMECTSRGYLHHLQIERTAPGCEQGTAESAFGGLNVDTAGLKVRAQQG